MEKEREERDHLQCLLRKKFILSVLQGESILLSPPPRLCGGSEQPGQHLGAGDKVPLRSCAQGLLGSLGATSNNELVLFSV